LGPIELAFELLLSVCADASEISPLTTVAANAIVAATTNEVFAK
jgi:hypothetical protein